MKKIICLICVAMLFGVLAGCGAREEVPQPTQPVDIRPLPPENPGSSLIDYDPNRQVYIASENIYVDFYIGVTNCPSFTILIYSKEHVDPADISISLPGDLPFVINVSEIKVPRKTEYMDETAPMAMPYHVYYAYRGGNFAELDTNTQLEKDFRSLKTEDVPEFYLYQINVAFINILELDAPVTVEKAFITFGGQEYEARFGRVRVLPKEDFPSDAQVVKRGKGLWGNTVQLYNDGLVKIDALEMENVPEDITITRLWMLEEETEILDLNVVIVSGKETVEMKWDGKTPIYLSKGDEVQIDAMIKNELTAKLLNSVHLQAAVEYTKDATKEKVCQVTTIVGTAERHPYEYNAIIFDGVDLESYYRNCYYKESFTWLNAFRMQSWRWRGVLAKQPRGFT